jgi:hypothetical protein
MGLSLSVSFQEGATPHGMSSTVLFSSSMAKLKSKGPFKLAARIGIGRERKKTYNVGVRGEGNKTYLPFLLFKLAMADWHMFLTSVVFLSGCNADVFSNELVLTASGRRVCVSSLSGNCLVIYLDCVKASETRALGAEQVLSPSRGVCNKPGSTRMGCYSSLLEVTWNEVLLCYIARGPLFLLPAESRALHPGRSRRAVAESCGPTLLELARA